MLWGYCLDGFLCIMLLYKLMYSWTWILDSFCNLFSKYAAVHLSLFFLLGLLLIDLITCYEDDLYLPQCAAPAFKHFILNVSNDVAIYNVAYLFFLCRFNFSLATNYIGLLLSWLINIFMHFLSKSVLYDTFQVMHACIILRPC